MHWFLEMLVFGGERRVPPAAIPSTWRRLFHITAGSSIPLTGIFVSESAMVWALALVATGGLVLDLVRFRIGWLNSIFTRLLAPLLKHDEGAHITGATYMVIAALLVYVLYGKDVAIPVMFFLSLGDPAAALVGRDMPGPRVFGKSPIGTAAFIVVAAAVLAVLISADGIEPHWALWVGAAVAGVVELATLPPDDNLTIPLVAGAAMFALGV
jgi:dolichol kinase